MKYFVGYLIRGEVAQWYLDVSKEISTRFGNYQIYDRIPPHVTIFRPFNSPDIDAIKAVLESSADHFPSNEVLKVNGFGQFHNRVVFAETEVSKRLKEIIKSLQDRIANEHITDQLEQFPQWEPHLTLANYLRPEEFKLIWEYTISLPKPNFSLPFDNLTIFHAKDDEGWAAGDIFSIK